MKKEQKELGLHNKNNNNNNKDDYQQINRKFQELSKYNDIQSTPVLKAKLCLLVLSLPAYELCQLPMQDAAKVLLCGGCGVVSHHHFSYYQLMFIYFFFHQVSSVLTYRKSRNLRY